MPDDDELRACIPCLRHRNIAGMCAARLEVRALYGKSYTGTAVVLREFAQENSGRRHNDIHASRPLRRLALHLKKLLRFAKRRRIHLPIGDQNGFHGRIVPFLFPISASGRVSSTPPSEGGSAFLPRTLFESASWRRVPQARNTDARAPLHCSRQRGNL